MSTSTTSGVRAQANPKKVERSREKGLAGDVANDVERAVQLVRDARRAKRPAVIIFQGNSVELLCARLLRAPFACAHLPRCA